MCTLCMLCTRAYVSRINQSIYYLIVHSILISVLNGFYFILLQFQTAHHQRYKSTSRTANTLEARGVRAQANRQIDDSPTEPPQTKQIGNQSPCNLGRAHFHPPAASLRPTSDNLCVLLHSRAPATCKRIPFTCNQRSVTTTHPECSSSGPQAIGRPQRNSREQRVCVLCN